jgi:hypothetical protein
VDHGDEIAREDLVVGAAVVAAHHQDRRADAGLAELDRLFEQRDAEAGETLHALERPRHRRRAVTVGVGLEDGPDPGRTRVPRDDAQVVAQGLQVDLGARRANGVRGGGTTGAEDAGHEGLRHHGSARREPRRACPFD